MQQTVLITGGSRGIGAAMARAFAAAGYTVAVNYHRSEAEARALVEELSSSGYSVRAFQADVSDPVQAQSLVDNVLDIFCQLDILICNAGVAWTGLLCDMTDTDYRRVLGTDLDGVFYCCRAAYRHMVHRKYGRILTISSMWGRSGASCEAAYSAAKAGVIGLTKALAQELGPSGVTVNCLAPGVIDTQMNCALSAGDLRALAEETPVGVWARPRTWPVPPCFWPLLRRTLSPVRSLGWTAAFFCKLLLSLLWISLFLSSF